MSIGARVPTAPVDLPRATADRLAEAELADPAYRAAQPSLIERAVEWVITQVQRVVQAASEASPGGWLGIVGLISLALVVAVLVRWRAGPVARGSAVTFEVDPQADSAQYRARAEALAAVDDWAGATTDRMRALVRLCQERGLIDGRAGWTTDEVAASLAHRLPTTAGALDRAARVFDDVRYGGRPASAASYRAVVEAEDLVAHAQAAR